MVLQRVGRKGVKRGGECSERRSCVEWKVIVIAQKKKWSRVRMEEKTKGKNRRQALFVFSSPMETLQAEQ